MIAFQSPLQAVHWCMFVQEALLVADWPPALLQNEHSREESSLDGRSLFRGMNILPHHSSSLFLHIYRPHPLQH